MYGVRKSHLAKMGLINIISEWFGQQMQKF